MTVIDKACYERGCACHDPRIDGEGVEVELKQPEQEPVAWADMDVRNEDKGLSWTPGHFHKTPLYTSPPASKPWVGLTDEAIWLEYQRFWPFHPAEEPTLAKDIAKFARAIEAKLREKNA